MAKTENGKTRLSKREWLIFIIPVITLIFISGGFYNTVRAKDENQDEKLKECKVTNSQQQDAIIAIQTNLGNIDRITQKTDRQVVEMIKSLSEISGWIKAKVEESKI